MNKPAKLTPRSIQTAVALLALTLSCAPSHAATKTWNAPSSGGAASGIWGTTGFWVSTGTPATGDTVAFDQTTYFSPTNLTADSTISLTSKTTITGINFNTTNGNAGWIISGATMSINGPIIATGTGKAATISITGGLTSTLATTLTGGGKVLINNFKNANGLTVQNGTMILEATTATIPCPIALGDINNNSGKLILGDSVTPSITATASGGLSVVGSGANNAIVGGGASVSLLSMNVQAAGSFQGNLGGPGANENNLSLAITGSPITFILSGNNTYTGGTVNSGKQTILKLGSATALPAGQSLSTTGSGIVDLNGNSVDISALNAIGSGVSATISNSSPLAVTMTFGEGNLASTISGTPIANVAGGGAISLLKVGSGAATIAMPQSYTGNTTINAGSLALSYSGIISSSPTISIAGGATCDVSGLATALTLASGQALAATGTSASGVLNMGAARGLTTAATSPLRFTLKPGNVPLTAVGGTMTIASGNPVTVTVANGGNPLPSGSYKLIAAGSGGAVAGSVALSPTPAGDLFAGPASMRITGGELWLDVSSAFSAYQIQAASTSPTAGVPDQLTITAVDSSGATVPGVISTLSLTFSGLANSPLGTAPTVTDQGGVAKTLGTATLLTFSGGVAQIAGGGAVLTAYNNETNAIHVTDGTRSDTTTGGSTVTLAVSPATANNLIFSTPPVSTTAGQTMTAFIVRVRDAYNNLLTNDGIPVTLTLNGASSIYSGTIPQNTLSGRSSFGDIVIRQAANGLTFTATIPSPSLTVTSGSFNITPDVPSTLQIETLATGLGIPVLDQSISQGGTKTVYAIQRDVYSNFVANVSVAWSLTNKTGAVLDTDLSPATGANSTFTANNNGSAQIFADYNSETLTATSGVLTVVAPIDHYVVTVSTPQAAGTPFPVTIVAQDSGNNTVDDSSTVVTMSVAPSTTLKFDGNGNSIFGQTGDANITLIHGTNTIMALDNKGEAGLTVTATDPNVKTGTSGSFDVNVAAATKLIVTLPGQTFSSFTGNSGSPGAEMVGAPFNITLTAVDANTNLVATYTGAKTVTYVGPGGTPSYTTAVTFTGGQASGLATTLYKAETTNITASVAGELAGVKSSSLEVDNTGVYTKLLVLVPGETAAPGTATGKSGAPSGATADKAFAVTVNATDDYFNLMSSIVNPITITSSDTSATLPVSAALVNGAKTFLVTFNAPGTFTVTATDPAPPFTATSSAITSTEYWFRSAANGTWETPATWEYSTDQGANWASATGINTTPTATNSTKIELRSPYNVTNTVTITLDQMIIDSGATNVINNSIRQTILKGPGTGTDYDLAGFLQQDGQFVSSNSTSILVENGAIWRWNQGANTPSIGGALEFKSGAKYQVNSTTSSGAVASPATWDAGSLLEVIGYTTATGVAGLSQQFANVTWNCPSQTSTAQLNGSLTNVAGNLTVLSTGTGELRLLSTGASNLVVGANLAVNGGTLTLASSSGTNTTLVGGNLTIASGGWLTMGIASSGNNSLIVTGNVSVAGILSNFTGLASVTFAKAGTQTLTCGAANFPTSTLRPISWIVNSGSTLDLGTSVVPGTGGFTNNAGGGLITAHASGFNGNLTLTGKSLSAGGNYTYNGSVDQVTGALLPATVNNLTINNTSSTGNMGVSLSGAVTVNGNLALNNGLLIPGANALVVSAAGTSSGGSATSYVSGSLQKAYNTGAAPTFAFPIGAAGTYAPVSVANLNVGTAGTLTASTTAGQQPNLTGAILNPSKDVNRYWTVNATLVPTTYDITLNWGSTEILGGGNYTTFLVAKYSSGSWLTEAGSGLSPTSATATGLTTFSDFAVGEPPCTPPFISTDSTPQLACSGAQAQFTVASTDGGATYQWRRNGSALVVDPHIASVTSATLTINPVAVGDTALAANGYDCIVTSTGGCPTNSTRVALSVSSPAVITVDPLPQSVLAGQTAAFSVTATGSGLTNQWQKDTGAGFTSIPGATASTYTTPATVGTDDGTQYRCLVGDSAGCGPVQTSNPALLTVIGISYRSVASGNWNTAGTWEASTNGAAYAPASVAPTPANSTNISVQATHTVVVSAATAIDHTVIQSGGVLAANGGTNILSGTGIDVFGSLVVSNVALSGISGATTSTLRFENGGKFIWNLNINPVLPTATWGDGSTCQIDNANSSGNAAPVGLSQNFYNFTWNYTTAGGSTTLTGLATTTTNAIRGDLTISAGTSGSTGSLRITSGPASTTNTLAIGGSLHCVTGFFVPMGGSGGNSGLILLMGGNVVVESGANVDLRNSGNGSIVNIIFTNTSTPQWLTNKGTIDHSGQGATQPGGAAYAWVVASGATLNLNDNLPVGQGSTNTDTMTVQGTLNFRNSQIIGTGSLNVSPGGTLVGTWGQQLTSGDGTNNFGGTLSLPGLPALAAGSNSKLFGAALYTGAFSAFNPSNPGASLVWDTSTLTADGKLRVGCDGSLTATLGSEVDALCNGGNGSFMATFSGGVGAPYTIQLDAGTPVAGQTSPQTFTVPAGSHTVTVTDANGCTITSSPILVGQPSAVVANAGAPQAICSGGSVQIGDSPTASGGVGGYLYSWASSPIGFSSAAPNPTVSPTATTTYTVTVTDANGCSAQSSVTVTVNPLPTVSVNSETICSGGSATLTATTSAGSPIYLWSPGGATTASITVSPSSTTTYTVTVTDGVTTCANSGSGTVTVNPSPVVTTDTSNQVACAGSAVTWVVNATGASLTYQWQRDGTNLVEGLGNFTGTTNASLVNSAVAAEDGADAAHGYACVITSGSCTTTSTEVSLTVNPLPTASVDSATICAGGSATLTATTSASSPSYLWSPGGATTASITVSPSSTTSYTVTVTDGVTGCANSASGTVTVNPLPTVSVNSPAVCAGDSATLTATTSAASPTYLWSPGGATTASITVSPSSTTPYTVTVTDGVTGCINSGSGTVTVNPLPTGTVSGDATICSGNPTTIQATLDGSAGPWKVTWSDGFIQTVSTSPATRSVSPTVTTIYTATIQDTLTLCSAPAAGSATVTMATLAKPNITAIQVLGGGSVKITFTSTGPSCQTYQVLASEDVTAPIGSWSVLGTGSFTSSTMTFTDTDAPHHALRFYQIKSP